MKIKQTNGNWSKALTEIKDFLRSQGNVVVFNSAPQPSIASPGKI